MTRLKFHRCQIKGETRPVTKQRLAAATRAIERDKNSWGLFAPTMTFPTPEERIHAHDEDWKAWTKEFRRHVARDWKAGRRILANLPPASRLKIIQDWNRWPGPKTSEYFLDFLNQLGLR